MGKKVNLSISSVSSNDQSVLGSPSLISNPTYHLRTPIQSSHPHTQIQPHDLIGRAANPADTEDWNDEFDLTELDEDQELNEIEQSASLAVRDVTQTLPLRRSEKSNIFSAQTAAAESASLTTSPHHRVKAPKFGDNHTRHGSGDADDSAWFDATDDDQIDAKLLLLMLLL
jgi:hypothetical protein